MTLTCLAENHGLGRPASPDGLARAMCSMGKISSFRGSAAAMAVVVSGCVVSRTPSEGEHFTPYKAVLTPRETIEPTEPDRSESSTTASPWTRAWPRNWRTSTSDLCPNVGLCRRMAEQTALQWKLSKGPISTPQTGQKAVQAHVALLASRDINGSAGPAKEPENLARFLLDVVNVLGPNVLSKDPDEAAYTVAYLLERSGDEQGALQAYEALVKKQPSVIYSSLAEFAVADLLDRTDDLAKKEQAKALFKAIAEGNAPAWTPVWEEARQRAGLPEGYISPAQEDDDRLKVYAAAGAQAERERKEIERLWESVGWEVDSIAELFLKASIARQLGPGPGGIRARAVRAVDAEIARRKREEYCESRNTFVAATSLAEFRKRAQSKCRDDPPKTGFEGRGLVKVPDLAAECRVIFATVCPKPNAPSVQLKKTNVTRGG